MRHLTRRSLFAGSSLLLLSACTPGQQASSQASGAASASASGSVSASDGGAQGQRVEAGYQLNSQVAEAPTVTLYTDLQCPYCAKADPKYRQAASQLEGSLNLVVRHFPLRSHANAVPAAQAVQAAEGQGAYLPMAELLFERQTQWGTLTTVNDLAATFVGYAQELGLDAERFSQDLSAQANLDLIQAELTAGAEAGVRGTPSFVVNGQVLEGVDSSSSVEELVAAFRQAAGL